METLIKINITDTVLKDATQYLATCNLKLQNILPIIKSMDDLGYYSLEAWGGVTFDACLRFLEEDPWERLIQIKQQLKKTPLQMILRGQNLLGYRHYADDVVEYFVKKSIENGVDIIRIFDPLNDVRNLETSIKACVAEKAHAQGAFCYTKMDDACANSYIKMARRFEELGCKSICINDMAGALIPSDTYDLVSMLIQNVKIPIHLHSSAIMASSDTLSQTYIKAFEAGVRGIDCAITPFSMWSTLPKTQSLVDSLKDTQFKAPVDLDKVIKITEEFEEIKIQCNENNTDNNNELQLSFKGKNLGIPGGMIGNLEEQLKKINKIELLDKVTEEVLRINAEFGQIPLVPPISQIIGTQAVMNVIVGDRYKIVTKETRALLKGEYGSLPSHPSDNVIDIVLGQESRIFERPADFLEPELVKAKQEISGYYEKEEDILSYIILPEPALKLFKLREAGKYGIDCNLGDMDELIYPV